MRRPLVISLTAILVLAILSLGATLIQGNSPKLGLDLQGGASVVLAPKAGSVVKPGTLEQAKRIISNRVNGLGVAEPNVYTQGSNIVIELPGVKNQDRALAIVGQTAQLEFRPVIQIVGGAGGLYDATAGSTLNTNTTTTTPNGGTTTVPGVTTTTPAPSSNTPATSTTTAVAPPAAPSTSKGALGAPRNSKTGRVSTAAELAQAAPAPPTSAPPSTSAAGPVSTTPGAAPSAPTTAAGGPKTTTAPGTPTTTPATQPVALTPREQITPESTVVVPELKPGTQEIAARYLLGPSQMNGNLVKDATAELANGGTGPAWEVKVGFNSAGSAKFDALAQANFQKQVAIVLDGLVVSAPTINAQQFNGTAIISGGGSAGFSHKDASNLALELRYGSLPVVLIQQTVQKVSATLGKSSLRAGLLAGVIGLVLVLLYMILYYRALGLVVVMGLAVSGALMYSLITFLSVKKGLALSLSGATGIIVSVGVTVDSYIVYFERLKDEIRAGKTVRSSVDRGFSRAWKTIWTADLVSLIGAALLYWLTVGQVRGFAFFLGLSTFLDLFVAYLFTRPMVVLLGRNRTFTEARFFGVARGLAMAPAGGTS